MQSQPPKQQQPCPVCGADPSSRIWSQQMTGFVVIRTEKHKHTGSRAKPLVCTVCGYVQLFVNPEDFRKIPAPPPTDIMPT